LATVSSTSQRKFRIVEAQLGAELRTISPPLLRCALGTIFCWFGGLKVVGASPVGDFVAGTLPWFDRAWLLPAVGLFEVAIGLGLSPAGTFSWSARS
jgi:hypothetical protein